MADYWIFLSKSVGVTILVVQEAVYLPKNHAVKNLFLFVIGAALSKGQTS
ncbi:hypothetical protein [Francisella persica]|nr:hypothetical protein [Francisella persica]